MARLLTLLPLLLVLSGCLAHKVRVESEPPGALVLYKGKRKGVTPVEFTTVFTPHLRNEIKRFRLRVVLPDHRPVVTHIGDDMRLWRYITRPFRGGIIDCLIPPFEWKGGRCIAPRSERLIVLVPDHGPSGTWTSQDIP